MCKVSVIMPAFKAEKYISKSIKSVLAQPFSDWELIVVDDGSPDDLASVVKKYVSQDLRIRLISQENQGACGARNRGVREATGKYVTFLDSDDIWLPDFLQKMVAEAESKEALFVYCGSMIENKDGKIRRLGFPYARKNVLKKFVFSEQIFHICGILIDRATLLEAGIEFSLGARFSEDIEFIIKVLTMVGSQVGVVPAELFKYCYQADSVTHEKWSRAHEDTISALGRAADFIEVHYTGDDKPEILAELARNQVTQMARTLWGSILSGDDEFSHYLVAEYPKVIRRSGRKIGHTVKLWFARKPCLWNLIRLLNGK